MKTCTVVFVTVALGVLITYAALFIPAIAPLAVADIAIISFVWRTAWRARTIMRAIWQKQPIWVTIAVFAFLFFLALEVFVYFKHFSHPLSRIQLLAALVLGGTTALSAALWHQAVSWLGTCFVNGVEVPPSLKTLGPYSLVRHPIYLSYLSLLGSISLSLFVCTAPQYKFISFAYGALSLSFLLLVLKERIRQEEYLAQKSFTEVWNDYARRTNPLLPSLQSSKNYLFQDLARRIPLNSFRGGMRASPPSTKIPSILPII
ncbi:protein-S-isoprenylcysteine O-methyltransferase Ste14 [Thermodesulfitimonas autotrophica]|uniref:Protein-S-isoprenylcysteine O-methyltransferase Ste14 n=1 Tax=Thermodesulfitimonas autotrophica TaxID=1894989 RepID=A0A3N5BIP6_9THEO|nr:hypothetical protein [Thermodesulfitimonas autotrophica]RPF49548.1 protein-S-isoprenylcysteine O-methyltransferase Ste14 [Thermodesulfitimonas autotrophica]